MEGEVFEREAGVFLDLEVFSFPNANFLILTGAFQSRLLLLSFLLQWKELTDFQDPCQCHF